MTNRTINDYATRYRQPMMCTFRDMIEAVDNGGRTFICECRTGEVHTKSSEFYLIISGFLVKLVRCVSVFRVEQEDSFLVIGTCYATSAFRKVGTEFV